MATPKILICHSEETLRETLKLILCDRHSIILTADTEQATHVLKHNQEIKLMVIEEDLWDAFKTVPRRIKTIVAGKGPSTLPSASSAKIVGFISKPFKAERILSIIEKNL
jgi:DNA-binding NtrC family response regulator